MSSSGSQPTSRGKCTTLYIYTFSYFHYYELQYWFLLYWFTVLVTVYSYGIVCGCLWDVVFTDGRMKIIGHDERFGITMITVTWMIKNWRLFYLVDFVKWDLNGKYWRSFDFFCFCTMYLNYSCIQVRRILLHFCGQDALNCLAVSDLV